MPEFTAFDRARVSVSSNNRLPRPPAKTNAIVCCASRCDSLSIGHSSLVLKAVQDVVSISKNSVESGGSVSETECTSPDDAICALSKAPMLRGVGQVPIKAVVVVPFGALGKLTAHKQQFLARMPPHVAVICP